MNNINSNQEDILNIVNSIWTVLISSNQLNFRIKCGRCLSVIPLFKNIGFNDNNLSNFDKDNPDQIMVRIISDYLVHIFEDSSSNSHDSAAYVTQELLTQLKCHITSNNDGSFGENWKLFSPTVQSIIFQFTKSRYNYKIDEQKSSDQSLIFKSVKIYHLWFPKFVSILLKVKNEQSKIQKIPQKFQCLTVVLHLSLQLCKYILPYLCFWYKNNLEFKAIFKSEFSYISTILNSNDSNFNEIDQARLSMLSIFSIFDSLINFKIFPSNGHQIKSFIYLEISSDEEIYLSALKCKLYERSLYHLEFFLRFINNSTLISKNLSNFDSDIIIKLKHIFRHLNERDSYEALTKILSNKTFQDDTLSLRERDLLFNHSSIPSVSFLNKLVKIGRYERALNDSLLYRKIISSPRLDAIISRSILRLSKWDSMSIIIDKNLVINYINDYNSGKINDFEDIIDIALSSSLYYLKEKDFNSSNFIIDQARNIISQELNETSQISFEKTIPSIIRFHIFEELEDFLNCLKMEKNHDFEKWSKWIGETTLNIDNFELITSFKSSLLNLLNSKDIFKKTMNLWIDLSRAYRKIGELFQSEIALSRAESFYKSNLTIIERAKISWARKQTTHALWIASSIKPILKDPEDNLIQGKVSLIRGKWSNELSSLDFKDICDLFKKASESLQKSGKAHYSLASIIDRKINAFLSFLEQNSTGQIPSTKKSNSTKFWSGVFTPLTIYEFFNDYMPLALSNYLNSIIYTPQLSHEVVPKILQLFFDHVKNYLFPEIDNNNSINNESNKNNFSTIFGSLSSNQKETIFLNLKNIMDEKISNVKTAIWTNSITQLISRIEQNSKLEKYLNNLIISCIKDYPYCSFWHLMFLKNSSSDNNSKKLLLIISIYEKSLNQNELKIFSNIYRQYDKITSNLKALSKPNISKSSKDKISLLFPKFKEDFENCQLLVPTLSNLIISPKSKTFSDPKNHIKTSTTIKSIKDEIDIFSSLQRPKRIQLLDNNGENHYFLCKEDDDLRKDMRMMEFASFINRILNHDRKCKERNLNITTFGVVCLDEKCGIIEWVENTKGFRGLIETIYHEHKKGLPNDKLRDYFYDGEIRNNSNIEKIKNNFLKKVLPEYPPLMHLWFASQFPQPSNWFQSRLRFIRSTSVCSL